MTCTAVLSTVMMTRGIADDLESRGPGREQGSSSMLTTPTASTGTNAKRVPVSFPSFIKRVYLWGSYQSGAAGKPEQQADYYLDTVKPAAVEFIVLDLEDVNSSKFLSAHGALLFVECIQQRIGR